MRIRTVVSVEMRQSENQYRTMKVVLTVVLLLPILNFVTGDTDTSAFDCTTHLTCTDCVSSQSPCHWCFGAHRCTGDTNNDCPNDILVTGDGVSIFFSRKNLRQIV